jgi:DNA-binding CsgD family transcriptional regulator
MRIDRPSLFVTPLQFFPLDTRTFVLYNGFAMNLLQQLLVRLGIFPNPELDRTYTLDVELNRSLYELAHLERRRPAEVHNELLGLALDKRLNANQLVTHWDALTARQQQVAALVCLGYQYKQIGQMVGLEENTVKAHVSHVLHKMRLENSGALRYAFSDWDFSEYARPCPPRYTATPPSTDQQPEEEADR